MPESLAFPAPPPLTLYVHIPWCVRKCPYCDFNSHQADGALPEAAYVDALLADLERELPAVWGRTLHAIFIGGGTPSLFSAEAIDRLLGGLRGLLALKPGLEITLEANPGTLEQGRFAEYRAAGINRLSIGVQSFDAKALERLGRIHGPAEARAAAEAAQAAGFDNINLDLMFGLPGQDITAALADLDRAIALQPAHLSWYQLTLEPNTRFHRFPPELPPPDVVADMAAAGQARLADAGYTRYEVSAYARDGRRCRHNLNYWQFGDYLGIGAGAHQKLTDAAAGRVERSWRLRHPRAYLEAADRVGGRRALAPEDLVFEYMLNALRLTEGFTPGDFTARTGLPWSSAAGTVESLVARELLEAGERIRPTPLGARFLDDLVAEFLPAAHA